ncbi:methyltransferase domain-containing protein [bacterium]|nr:MAG: methyltransferase domain-containing protein [bacterium]
MSKEMKCLVDSLREKGYDRLKRYPLRKYLFSVPLILNEIGVFSRFSLNGNNIFSISLKPTLYLKLGLDKGLNFIRDAFFINKDFSIKEWERFFTKNVIDGWISEGMICEIEEKIWRFAYRIVPYNGLYFITSRFDRTDPGFTFLSYDSLYFASFLKRRLNDLSFYFENGIDLCCGVGVQAISIAHFCKNVIGTDINKKAVELARLNASLNNVRNCNFTCASLFEKADTRFDLIVSNPPFISFRHTDAGPVDSDGGEPFGLGITLNILSEMDKRLTSKGRAFIITRSAVVKGKDYLFSHLREYLPEGLGCAYHYVSDSINSISLDENKMGISGYRHVIMEISRGGNNKFIRYPFFHRKTSVF